MDMKKKEKVLLKFSMLVCSQGKWKPDACGIQTLTYLYFLKK